MQPNGRGVHMASDDVIDWRTILTKRKGVIVVVMLATLLTAYVGVRFILPELYEAKASVLVKLGRENIEVPATVQKGSVVSAGVRKEELNSEIQMLTAPSLITEVVDRLGLDAFKGGAERPPGGLREYAAALAGRTRQAVDAALVAVGLKKQLSDRDKAIVGITGALSVAGEVESQVITVKLRLPDPDLAVRVLDVLLQLYFDHHIEVWRGPDAKAFFDVQVDSRRRQVHDLETAREAVKAKLSLVAVAEQRTLLLRQLDAFRTEIENNEVKKAGFQAQERAMQARLDALPDDVPQTESVSPNPLVQFRKERLTTLQQERARRATVYAPESEPIKNLDREIANLEQLLAQDPPTVVASRTVQANPLKTSFVQGIEQARVQIDGFEAASRQLRGQVAALEDRLREINTGERQLRLLDREYQMAEEGYLAYAKRMEEGRISEELDRRRVANITVLSPPVRPIEPVFPRKLLIMALSIPSGLLLGVVLAVLLESASEAVTVPRDVGGVEGLAYLGKVRV